MPVRNRYNVVASMDWLGPSEEFAVNGSKKRGWMRFFSRDVMSKIVFLITMGFVIGLCVRPFLDSLRGGGGGCRISLGNYQGREANPDNGRFGSPICLVNSKFLKVQLHKVQLPGMKQIINDWIFIDYHDRVNVLVQNKEGEFLVFEQTKHALENRLSLAIVGGIVEPGEDPRDTAIREVEEELHQHCQQFHFLGRFVTDVNRGMGFLNSFLATGCQPSSVVVKKKEEEHKSSSSSNDHNVAMVVVATETTDQVGTSDSELQVIKHLSQKELKEAFTAGKFLEVQWTATIGLALSHESLKKDDM